MGWRGFLSWMQFSLAALFVFIFVEHARKGPLPAYERAAETAHGWGLGLVMCALFFVACVGSAIQLIRDGLREDVQS